MQDTAESSPPLPLKLLLASWPPRIIHCSFFILGWGYSEAIRTLLIKTPQETISSLRSCGLRQEFPLPSAPTSTSAWLLLQGSAKPLVGSLHVYTIPASPPSRLSACSPESLLLVRDRNGEGLPSICLISSKIFFLWYESFLVLKGSRLLKLESQEEGSFSFPLLPSQGGIWGKRRRTNEWKGQDGKGNNS